MTAYTLHSQGSYGLGASGNLTLKNFGVEFEVSETVSLTGIWWFSGSASAGDPLPIACALYDANTEAQVSGTLNSSPTWSGAAGSGWIKCTYDGSVSLNAGTKYVAVVNSGGAQYYQLSAYWTSGAGASGLTNGPLSAPGNAASVRGQMTRDNGTSIAFPVDTVTGFDFGVDVEVTLAGGGTPSASLTVIPSFSAAGAASRFRSAALTVAVALSASPVALHVPSAALTVTPSLSASAGSTAPRTASLTIVPSLAAAPAAAHAPSASLSVVPAFSAAASHTGDVSHTASASLTVRPVLRATASHTGTELPGYPDPEAAVADLLADLVTAAYAGSRTLSVIQAGKLPALRTVRQAGGSSDRVTDTSVISVAVFAGSPDTAKAVAEQVRQRLVRGPFLSGTSFRTAHGRIDKATVDQAPQLVTSPEVTAVQCATAVYQISMRR